MTQAQRTLNNRYELVAKVGDGGMAVVFKALDHKLNRTVAVKVLRETFSSDQQFLSRFNREAQSAASLSHPNIVSVYDVGEDGNFHYIVMEYIEGVSLKDYITSNSPLPVNQAVEFAIKISNAIGYAHTKGLIHRDIKPQNILLTADLDIKVTDFGIAKGLGDATLTQTGFTLGTVHYFSPEQAQGKPAMAQSDLYSIGIVLYEMLTGRIPFESDSPVALALKHIEEPPPSPRRFNPNIPVPLEQLVLKSLAKSPTARFQSATAFTQALKDFAQASEMGTMAVPRVPGSPNNRPPTARVEEDFASPTPPKPAIRRPLDPEAYSAYAQGSGYDPNQEVRRRPITGQGNYQPNNYIDNQADLARRYNSQSSRPISAEDRYDEETPTKRGSGCVPWVVGGLLMVMLAGLVVLFFVFLLPPLTKPSPTATPVLPTATLGPAAKVVMPDVRNKTLDEAESALKAIGLQLGTTKTQFDDKVDGGKIISQSIAPKAQVDKGAKIDLVISQGVDAVELPQRFVNTPYDETKKSIENLGLKTQQVDQPSDSIGPGAVIKTDPEGGPGVKVPRSTVIKIFVSTGPLPTATPVPPTVTPVPPTPAVSPTPKVVVTVPSGLIGKKQADATKQLVDAGFTVDVVQWNLDDIKRQFPGDQVAIDTWNTLKEGDVLGINPPAGTKLDKGAKVTMAVKKL
jgi:serine/threonine-protein kinase